MPTRSQFPQICIYLNKYNGYITPANFRLGNVLRVRILMNFGLSLIKILSVKGILSDKLHFSDYLLIQCTPPVFIFASCWLTCIAWFTCRAALSFFQEPNTIVSSGSAPPESSKVCIGFGTHRPPFLVQATPPVCGVTGLDCSRLVHQQHIAQKNGEQKPHPVFTVFNFPTHREN